MCGDGGLDAGMLARSQASIPDGCAMDELTTPGLVGKGAETQEVSWDTAQW